MITYSWENVEVTKIVLTVGYQRFYAYTNSLVELPLVTVSVTLFEDTKVVKFTGAPENDECIIGLGLLMLWE